jgi:hypothetical protein
VITVVSGLPRSGTSLMMQMLVAGGLVALTDGVRAPDDDNPRGYHEWEPIKRLRESPELIAAAEGKVVKVISSLLPALPGDRRYRVLFMRRSLPEVLASQATMIGRRGTSGPPVAETVLAAAMQAHLAQISAWLERQPHLTVAWVDYHALLAHPLVEASRIATFLGGAVDTAAMARQVDPTLHRQRQAPAMLAGVAPVTGGGGP